MNGVISKILLTSIISFGFISCNNDEDYTTDNSIGNITILTDEGISSRASYKGDDVLKTSGRYKMYFSSNDEILIYNDQNKSKGKYHYQGNTWHDIQPKAQWSVDPGQSEFIIGAYPYNRASASGNIVTFDVDLNPSNFGHDNGYFFEAYPNNSINCPVYFAGRNYIQRASKEGGTSAYDTNYLTLKYYCSQFVIEPPVSWQYIEEIIVKNEGLTDKFQITIDNNNNGTVKQIGVHGDYKIEVSKYRGINNSLMNSNPLLITLPPLSGETKVCVRYYEGDTKVQKIMIVNETKINEKYI